MIYKVKNSVQDCLNVIVSPKQILWKEDKGNSHHVFCCVTHLSVISEITQTSHHVIQFQCSSVSVKLIHVALFFLLKAVWWHLKILNFHFSQKALSLCVDPERISPLTLTVLNATFYCFSAITEEENKEDFEGF